MTSFPFDRRRRAAALLAPLLLCGTGAALAQPPATPPGFVHVPETPDLALSRNLLAIASNPKDVEALKGAGKAALQLGDAQSALSFFARAEEAAPRDGRAKAGIASSLVMLEQASSAFKFFDDAMSLGVPEAEIAGDRGLAYDLTGNPRRAQKDYQLALRRQDDPDVRQRLALSLAISGDRDAALSTIDSQLRTNGRGAWRTRAFILALTGDTAGATQAVRAVMPAQAAAMEPFLARLPSLNPADRALAVNFGHFPESGTALAAAAPSAPQPSIATPNVLTNGRPDTTQPALGSRAAVRTPPAATQTAAAPAQRSSVHTQAPAQQLASASPAVPRQVAPPAPQPRIAPAPAARMAAPSPDSVAADFAQVRGRPLVPASSRPAAASQTYGPPAPATTDAALAAPGPATQIETAATPSATTAAASAAAAPGFSQPQVIAPVELPPSTPAADTEIPIIEFADVAAIVSALPSGEEGSSQRSDVIAAPAEPVQRKPAAAAAPSKPSGTAALAAATKAKAAAKAAAASPRDAKAAKPSSKPDQPGKADDTKGTRGAKAKEPSRIWVQLAHGSSPSSLTPTLDRVRKKAPKLISGRTAWASSAKGTSRLLLGPFKSDKEAKAFVDQLDKEDVKAISWTSPAGQSVEKLSSK